MSDRCGDMECEVKVPLDTSALDAASAVKPADVDDVYSLEKEALIMVELAIHPTAIRPSDFVYMQQPCKLERVEGKSAGSSSSVESRVYYEADKSYSTTSDQADARTTSVENTRPQTCDTCNKYFKCSRLLKIHKKTHTNVRPYNCEACNKCFKQRSHLTVHIKTHTGERPYKCEVCNKFFTQRSHLTVHTKTHTGERPHKCEVCNKFFTQRSHLTVHVKRHTGEQLYYCEVCNKCFTNHTSLMRHVRTHAGERPYKCEVCYKCFTQCRNYITHMKTHRDVVVGDC